MDVWREMIMLAVGGLDCWVQVGVPGRGLARGSCWILRLPPCSRVALSDSTVGLCPSHARVLDGNLPGEDPPYPQWVPIVGIPDRSAARRSWCHGSTSLRPQPLAKCAGTRDGSHAPGQVQQPVFASICLPQA